MRRLLPLLLLPLLAACVMPGGGTAVFVDMRAGDFWNGEGRLLDVSDDDRRCLVAIRDRALIVHERWVDCAHVHATSVRDRKPESASLGASAAAP